MTTTGPGRGRLVTIAIALAVVVVAGGLGLAFFGYGAEVTTPRVVSMRLGVDGVRPEIAALVKVGDPAYSDLAGVELGRVTAVKVEDQPVVVGDAKGVVHAASDPTHRRIDVTVTGSGRVGTGLIIIGAQVIQAGKNMPLVSDRYSLSAKVLSVDVR